MNRIRHTLMIAGLATAAFSQPGAAQRSSIEFTVEATSFRAGGQGCGEGPFQCGGGYYDETPGNWGDAQVRPGTDVDLWYDDGGIVIGGLDGLEWVTFPVNVPQSGRYRVTFRVASPADRPSGSGVVNVGVYGVDGSWLENQTVPITGGAGEWHEYISWQAPTTVFLPAGAQTLTMWAAGGYYNVHNITFTLETADPVPDPIVPGQLNPIVLSGFVRDQAGMPIADARVVFRYCSTLCNAEAVLHTDGAGHYELSFDAVPDGYFGALAWARLDKDFFTRYEHDSRFITVATQHANYDFVLRDIEWLTADGATDVTVDPNDPVCINNAQDPSFGSNAVCHPLRVIAPSDGTLRIEMVPTGPVTGAIGLEIETLGGDWIHCCEASGVYYVPVTAGEQVFLNPQVSPRVTQSFRILTSMGGSP
jgi:carbohydrate binding protein with CBM6 domain